jgi:hypothetical protein
MSDHAEITSIDAIADFRAALLIYISKVRPLLDDSADEVFRTREWLRVSQRVYWENQIRTRTRELTDAQQALFSAELAKLRAPSSAEIVAVQKAKRALAVAEEKLHTLKRASANFEREAVPRLKQIENLRTEVATDLQEAVYFLDRIVGTLDRYVNSGPSAQLSSSISSSATEPIEEPSTETSEKTE